MRPALGTTSMVLILRLLQPYPAFVFLTVNLSSVPGPDLYQDLFNPAVPFFTMKTPTSITTAAMAI